jgi:hypothetical protein
VPTAEEIRRATNSLQHALAPEDRERNPGYAALADSLSHSATAVALLCEVPRNSRNPVLLLGILHYHALGGHHELATLFDALRHGTIAPEAFAHAATNVVESNPDLITSERHRTTQTNEVGRTAVIGAVLRTFARRGIDAVDLIDLGCSAGLNLYPDLFPLDQADRALSVSCDAPAWSLTGGLPRIETRIGVDREPLDVNVADDVRWLRACVWPEDRARGERLDAALNASASWPARTLLAGSLPGVLDEAFALTSGERPVVVMHTWVAAYLSPDEQSDLAQRLRERVATTDTSWFYLEWPRGVAGLKPPPPTEPTPSHGDGAAQLVVTLAGEESQHWGWAHSHGRWLAPSAAFGPKA